jgi:hypothetical protein
MVQLIARAENFVKERLQCAPDVLLSGPFSKKFLAPGQERFKYLAERDSESHTRPDILGQVSGNKEPAINAHWAVLRARESVV